MATSRAVSRLSGHLPALDGLRGLAILPVLFAHFMRLQPTNPFERQLSRVAATGWLGVDLFFVLSGFLITGILLEAKGGQRFFRNFYLRRAFRIFPLYYGSLLLVFVGLPHLHLLGAERTRDLLHSQGWYWSYLANVRIVLAGSWNTSFELEHFWSLAVEEQFYLVWPLVVWLLSRERLKTVCLGAVLVSFVLRMTLRGLGQPGVVSYVLTPAHLDPLAAGAWLALVASEPGGLEWLRAGIRPVLVVGSVGVTVIVATAQGPVVGSLGMLTIGYPLLALTCAALLAGALTAPAGSLFGRLWRSRVLGFFGRLSYGLYVLHPLLMGLVVLLGFDVPWFAQRAGSQLLGQAIFTGMMLAVSAVVALVSWHAWEQPFLRLKARFPMRGPSPLLLPPDPELAGWTPEKQAYKVRQGGAE
jgi:peptidoglycan/LPS O-acetylase OafA/YrhL